ncbi:MAG TPA: Cache 3/Cache 2 fusion domain-containing protein, partial [Burkholderiaceae bacterium]|nr:Cache 3/Cache 2 fusion domain-containing protein [Burkholderiaceae bacterium]
MNESSASNRSVARRVTLLSLAMIAGVLIAASVAIGVITQRNARDQVVNMVGDKAQSLVNAADTTDATNRELIRRAHQAFQQNFEPTLILDEATSELKNYGSKVNDDYSIVDKFTKDTGSVATVFARKGDDFVRVTTSLKKQDGERAQGTLLDRTHPAYPLVLAGKPYTGRADLFGKPYMTHYEPVKDLAGKIVGILFVGNDISLFLAGLQKQVTDAHFFETGGFYVIDPRNALANAVFLVHPTARGKKVLEAFPQSEKFFSALAATSGGFVADADAILNPAGGGDEWAVMRKTKSNGWWVVAEVSNQQAMAQHHAGMVMIWVSLALAVVLLGVGLFLVLRHSVSRPLRELTSAITTVAHGDLTQEFRTTRRDEIGALVREVESMRKRYLQMMLQVRTSVDSITTASAEIAMGNTDLSHRTEQTAANLQTTASSMEQLTGTVQQTSNSAHTANQLASSA